MDMKKVSDGLHKASSVVAILGSVLVAADQLLSTVPAGLSGASLWVFLGSGLLSTLGFGTKNKSGSGF